MKDFAKTMRGLGAAALVASGVAFMFEGWSTLTSVGKYFSFGGFILAMGAAGAFCSYVIRENKGARTFLGLAAAAITAQATQLGAMIYALFHPVNASLPGMFVYEAVNVPIVAGLVGLSVIFLTPVAGLGFASLNRPQAKLATGLFLALNALLLIPTRVDTEVMGFLALGVALFAYSEKRAFSRDPAMQTGEGWIIRGILATPLLALCGRELFYPISAYACGMLEIGMAAGLFALAKAMPMPKASGMALQGLSLPFFLLGWSHIAFELHAGPLFFWLPLAWMMLGLSFYSLGDGRGLRAGGAILAVIACGNALFQMPNMLHAVALMANGITLVTIAFALEEASPLYAGMLSFFFGLAYSLVTALNHYAWNSWMGLALIGGAVLLLSSYLERNRERLFAVYAGYRARTATWK